jgi:predicted amidophosphoribosyltransferase
MCPSCQTAPPVGAWWTCSACGKPFDVFESKAVCPHCNARFDGARCLDCGETHPMSEWHVSNPPVA